MHDLQRVYAQCLQELTALGIQCGIVRQVVADGRTKGSWGSCRRNPDGSFRIAINPKLLADSTPPESLRQTMLHELLHTAAPGEGHKGRWKELAHRVNCALGTRIKRTASWEEQGLDGEKDAAIRYRYACAGCGREVVRYRACPFTRHPNRYRCGHCGGKFQKK